MARGHIMTKTELNQSKALLVLRGVELDRLTGHRDGIRIKRTIDQLEEVQPASEHALAVRNLDREYNEPRNVRALVPHSETKMQGSRRSTAEWRLPKHAPIHVLIVESHAILREGIATIINQEADML